MVGKSATHWSKLVLAVAGAADGAARTEDVLVASVREATCADSVSLLRNAKSGLEVVAKVGDVDLVPPEIPDEGVGVSSDGLPSAAVPVMPNLVLVCRWRDAQVSGWREKELLDVLRAFASVVVAAASGEQEALGMLFDVAKKIIASVDLDEVLLTVANAAATILNAEIAGVLLLGASGRLEMRCAVGHRTVKTARLRVSPGQGMAGKVLQTGRPARVDEYENDRTISNDFLLIAREEGTKSAAGVPMQVGGENEGVLCVWRRRRSVFMRSEIRILAALGDLAAVAVERARLYEAQAVSGTALEAVHAELEARYESAERALSIHQTLTLVAMEGSDLLSALGAVQSLTNGRVALLGDDWQVLAELSEGAGTALGRLASQTSLSESDLVDTATLTVEVASGTTWMLQSRVRAAGISYGSLLIEISRPPTPDDVVAAGETALVCAMLIARSEASLDAARRLQFEFIWDLLEGRIIDETDALVHSMHLGKALEFPARVFLVELHESERASGEFSPALDVRERDRQRCARSMVNAVEANLGTRLLFTRRANRLVLLVPVANHESMDFAKRLARTAICSVLTEDSGKLGTSVGLSAIVSSSRGLAEAYRQAQLALSAASPGGEGTAAYEDLGIVRFLLSPTSRADLDRLAEQVLGAAQRYDDLHHGDLIVSLRAYLDLDCNLQRSAERIHVHHKTIRYRLHKLEMLTGLDLARQEDRFRASLALKILSLDIAGSDLGDLSL